ncbi:MAG TPA: DUF3567 family protein [Burkholderiales bacterium]|nr:DUF3567 family protein [Burkholderiales bacterium]
MNIVYDSENYYVLEYPAQNGYEVVDKQAGRGTYLHGDVARKFRTSIIDVIAEDPSIERVDEFLADFGGPIDFRVAVH